MSGTYKIRVAKPGYSHDDTDISHIVFDSDINCFKIRSTAVVSLTVTNMSYTVNHSLGYSPAFLLWFEVDGNGKWFPMDTIEDQSGKGVCVYCSSDDSYLNISWTYASQPTSLKVFYMLIVDPVN